MENTENTQNPKKQNMKMAAAGWCGFFLPFVF